MQTKILKLGFKIRPNVNNAVCHIDLDKRAARECVGEDVDGLRHREGLRHTV